MPESDQRTCEAREKGLWVKSQDDLSIFTLPPASCAVLGHPFYSSMPNAYVFFVCLFLLNE